jgi:hypothetical protein
MSEEKRKSFLEGVKNRKVWEYGLVIVLVIAVFVFVLTTFSDSESRETSADDPIATYVSDLEKKLSSVLSAVEGAGKVKVIITVEAGMETVYAYETVTKGDVVTESPVLVGGKPVIVKEIYPPVAGVLIVAKGANSISVMRKLQQATISLLNVDIQQIEILTMK